jgi:ribosomal protein S18 acetylase RimI-like enzyme
MFDVDTATSTTADEPPQGRLAELFKEQTKKFKVEILNESDIPAFLALQQKVADTIPEDKKHHLKIRDENDLLTHMGHRMPIIGVKDEKGVLVGQCLLSYPCQEDAVKNLAGYPLNESKATTAIIQSLAVDPDFRGFKIADQILDGAKEVAGMSGRVLILAKVAQDNAPSTKTFMGAAFAKASEGLDPVKGYPVTYWQYNLYQGCDAKPV